MSALRSALALPLVALLALPACAQQRPAAPTASPAPTVPAALRPKLVLLLTVDQLRPEYLAAWDAQFTGGFRRLLDEGILFSRAAQDHAITETAPGHASTLSGRFPYSTGIASNSAGVNTSTAPLVQSEGTGASPFRFQGSTLADWMVAADPRTRVLSVSRKDRGAILPIGRGKFPVYWYAPRSGYFTTSSWYADSLPSWVQAFNAEDHAGTRYAGRTWDLLLPESNYPEPDSVAAESAGQGFRFPYMLAADPAMARNTILGYPWMDEMTLAFAWRGVRALDLGGGPQTDLLAVSLSTTDAVGHRWGPDSRELHDQILRLDRMLGVFLDSLYALRGRDNVAIALTADHGVAPMPEVRSRFGNNRGSRRMSLREIDPVIARVAPMLTRAGIPGDALALDWPVLEVDRSKTVGKERELLAIARTFAQEVRRLPGIQRADVIDDLVRADTVRDAIARRWLHMFRPGGSALVGITVDPYNVTYGTGAQHGQPHDYDAGVPVLFAGRAFIQGIDTGTARVVDIAPTLAHLLGITPGERLDGVVLGRAFRPSPD